MIIATVSSTDLSLPLLLVAMEPITQDKRVSQGYNGDLYFSNVLLQDMQTDYSCNARFHFTHTIQQKNPFTLKVLTSKCYPPRTCAVAAVWVSGSGRGSLVLKSMEQSLQLELPKLLQLLLVLKLGFLPHVDAFQTLVGSESPGPVPGLPVMSVSSLASVLYRGWGTHQTLRSTILYHLASPSCLLI